MTVLTKPSITIKKSPLISESRDSGDEVPIGHTTLAIDVQPPRSAAAPCASARQRRYTTGVLFCMFSGIFLLSLLGVFTALQVYDQIGARARHRRYQGYCSIPLSKDMQMLESRKMALHADVIPNADSDMQLVNVDEDGDLSASLREMLDINVDDSLERIAVYNNGHAVSFLHDFESNVTGIVDSERCFLMDLDPEVVMRPEVFVVGLQAGEEFDVGLVRSSLVAALPAIRDAVQLARGLADRCADRPTYRLHKENGTPIRKRSVSEPAPAEYVQFAGRRVQQIHITNMRALQAHERAARR